MDSVYDWVGLLKQLKKNREKNGENMYKSSLATYPSVPAQSRLYFSIF